MENHLCVCLCVCKCLDRQIIFQYLGYKQPEKRPCWGRKSINHTNKREKHLVLFFGKLELLFSHKFSSLSFFFCHMPKKWLQIDEISIALNPLPCDPLSLRWFFLDFIFIVIRSRECRCACIKLDVLGDFGGCGKMRRREKRNLNFWMNKFLIKKRLVFGFNNGLFAFPSIFDSKVMFFSLQKKNLCFTDRVFASPSVFLLQQCFCFFHGFSASSSMVFCFFTLFIGFCFIKWLFSFNNSFLCFINGFFASCNFVLLHKWTLCLYNSFFASLWLLCFTKGFYVPNFSFFFPPSSPLTQQVVTENIPSQK